jgi:Xaa-Pro aminopeptidase
MTRLDPASGIPPSVFEGRRSAVFEALAGGVMVLPSAPLLYRSRDTEVPYRPDSELYWATGAREARMVAVLVGGGNPCFALFAPERDDEEELWTGPRIDPEEAARRMGAHESYPLSELEGRLPSFLRRGARIHHRLGVHRNLDRIVVGALSEARIRGPRKGTGPRGVVDPGEILDELRLVKDVHELDCMRRAAALSVAGHRAGVAALAPGVGEWEIQAAVEAAFRRAGGSGPGYGTIVGSGANACVLHYVANERTVEGGDLVLLDAGAEVDLYQGDITRTYPVGGRFSPLQAEVYRVVEAARAAAVSVVRPGATVSDVHRAGTRVLLEGLVALRVLRGTVDELVEQRAHRPFFPHQTSHWLGLDVHDPGDYARDGASRTLEAGMVLTVEPGLYFPPGQDGDAVRFAGIGVRIEDDIVVTPDGGENLTADLPTALADVEAMVRGAR